MTNSIVVIRSMFKLDLLENKSIDLCSTKYFIGCSCSATELGYIICTINKSNQITEYTCT
jgi:hypothetical protein